MLRRLNTPQLVLLFGPLSVALSFAMQQLLSIWFPVSRPDTEQMGDMQLLVNAVVFAPLIETAISQLLPFLVLERFKRWPLQVVISAILFVLVHLGVGLPLLVGVYLIKGVFYAYLFHLLASRSYSAAYAGVAIVHALTNAAALVLDRVLHL
ncbi:type II CAAX prenyl endopeptidase Rce1 family protein [Chitinimonas sp.]|uniref:CPBP family glutamic-type intramembrane protease n=1 Tax=Chitinimonas sp. TaxID=1934313 RepID=UPI002F9270FD